MTAPSLTRHPSEEDQPPRSSALIFVHGFHGDRWKTWGLIPCMLRASNRAFQDHDFWAFGYASKLRIDLPHIWSADPDIPILAAQLQTAVESRGISRVMFVAHSMGGLIVQKALSAYQDVRRATTHFVQLGTPSGGLRKAWVGWLMKKQIRNMAKDSAFLKELGPVFQAGGLRFLAVAGSEDQFVPPESSLNPFPPECCRCVAGNHLSMLDADSAGADCVQLLKRFLTDAALPADAPPKDAGALTEKEAIQRALQLDATRGWEEAMHPLKAFPQLSTDGMGVLAGRYKRRWWFENRKADAEEAARLYGQAYELSVAPEYRPDQAYYHAINLAYLALAFEKSRRRAERFAQLAHRHCSSARAMGNDYWRLATQADAEMLLGDPASAIETYQSALRWAPALRERVSILTQAARLAAAVGVDASTENRILGLFAEHSY